MGPVVDVVFESTVPALYNALEILKDDERLVLEVAQHLGGKVVRAIAMGPTEGLSRGLPVKDLGEPISVPVGPETLGRMFNVLGEPIDGLPELKTKKKNPIHQAAPEFKNQSTEAEVFETGIKVIDVFCAFSKGGKV